MTVRYNVIYVWTYNNQEPLSSLDTIKNFKSEKIQKVINILKYRKRTSSSSINTILIKYNNNKYKYFLRISYGNII